MSQKQFGEYADKGDYHIRLDPNWPYLPIYLAKMEYMRRTLDKISPNKKLVDLGCGEGILVREYREKGLDIIGLDANYSSEYVQRGNLLATGFPDAAFDIVLCLDVIEHLPFTDQTTAIREFARLLPLGGTLLLSVPNLAHLASRLSFFVRGEFIRTSAPERHLGDRPGKEYARMLQTYFKIRQVKGIFPTYPLISFLTYYKPAKSIPLHRLYNRLLAYPPFCFLNIFECERLATPV
jgi:SAM-dependent methyltransferase